MLLDSSKIFCYIQQYQRLPSWALGFPFIGTNFLSLYICDSSSDSWRFATCFHIPTITNSSWSKYGCSSRAIILVFIIPQNMLFIVKIYPQSPE